MQQEMISIHSVIGPEWCDEMNVKSLKNVPCMKSSTNISLRPGRYILKYLLKDSSMIKQCSHNGYMKDIDLVTMFLSNIFFHLQIDSKLRTQFGAIIRYYIVPTFPKILEDFTL